VTPARPGLPARLLETFGGYTELPGVCHRLGPIGNVKLAIDTGRVGFDSARRYHELLGDLLVGSTQGREMENLQLANKLSFLSKDGQAIGIPRPVTHDAARVIYL